MTPELKLLLLCARVHLNQSDVIAVRQMLVNGIDWTSFARKSVGHGLTAIVEHTLSRVAPDMVPSDILDALRLNAEQIYKRNQTLFQELAGVIAALANTGIEVIPLRGPVLALQAYGDIGLRECQKLEFLVRDTDMAPTMTVLRDLGYEREKELNRAQIAPVQRLSGRNAFYKKATGIAVEPHTGFTPEMASEIDYAGLWHRAGRTTFDGRTMIMLAPEDGLLHLALHGGQEMWRRIGWACDFAAFVAAHRNLDWLTISDRAKAQGIQSTLLLATSLARRHFDAAIPETIARLETDDPAIEKMVEQVLAGWASEESFASPGSGDMPGMRDAALAPAFAVKEVKPGLEKHEAARQGAVRALDIDPGNREAHFALADSLLRLGRNKDAIIVFRTLVATDPHDVNALQGLASALLATTHLDEALSLLRLAVSIAPEDAKANFGLGIALQKMDRYAEAEAAFERSIALQSNFLDAWITLGRLHLESGNLEKARTVLTQAMMLAPGNVMILYNLTLAGKVRDGDPVFTNLQSLLMRAPSLPALARDYLYFALAKAYRDTGDQDAGFRHLLEGNAIRRQRFVYDEVRALAELEETRREFSAKVCAPALEAGNPSQVPIFVIGMPRSGSTLIEQILASHPKVFGAGECQEFPYALNRQRERFGSLKASEKRAAITSPAALRELGTTYLEAMRLQAPDAARIVDKRLGNFRLAGLIHLALPNARIIHAMRDPIDTCLSCFSHTFGEGALRYSYDLGELGRYYRAYLELMAHWRSVLPAGVMLEVEYESLVRDFEPWARRIVSHTGLEWDDACLNFHETKRVVRTASFVQVRQPLYQTSIGRWRPDEKSLRPLLQALAGSCND